MSCDLAIRDADTEKLEHLDFARGQTETRRTDAWVRNVRVQIGRSRRIGVEMLNDASRNDGAHRGASAHCSLERLDDGVDRAVLQEVADGAGAERAEDGGIIG